MDKSDVKGWGSTPTVLETARLNCQARVSERKAEFLV